MLTERQRNILRKDGYSDKDIDEMSYEFASSKIGEILASPKDKQANRAPYHKEVRARETESYQKKSGFDATSSYTRQATDLVIAMLGWQNQLIAAGHIKVEAAADIGTITNQAINCVRAMKKEFE